MNPMVPRLRGAVPFLTLTFLVVAGPATAQEGASIFTLLDPRGDVGPGQEVTGQLTETDFLADGRRVQAWGLEGQAGEAIQIDLTSGELDPYLYVAGPGLGELSDDDGGDGVNSRICVELPETGRYHLVASSFGSGTGAYNLRVEDRSTCSEEGGGTTGMVDLEMLDPADRQLPWDGTAEGALTGADPTSFGSPVQAWAVEGRAGETLTIDLVSADFDAYLTFVGPGLGDWITNDDGAGRCDSRITVTFPENGAYRAVASSLSGSTGAFTLNSYRDPPDPQPGLCIPPASASAPVDAATAAEVPAHGSVSIGSIVNGSLTAEYTYRNRPAQRWTLDGRAGQQLVVYQASDLIDSYLFFRGPGFEEPLTSDDVDGTLNSRICVTLPETATYDVIASAFSSGTEGPYRLMVASDPEGSVCEDFQVSLQAAFRDLPAAGTLEPGSSVDGELDPWADEVHPEDGTTIDVYALEGRSGESVFIDLISQEFDAYLSVVGPGLADAILDDDGGGQCNSRIQLVPTASGTFRVIVSALGEGAGAYTLRASREAGPVAPGECSPGAMFTPVPTVTQVGLEHIRPESGRAVPVGGDVAGELRGSDPIVEEGKHGQAWTVELEAGETFVVELISEDFDPYLYLTGPGLDGALGDDDGGPGTNARITFTPRQSGEYTAVVSTFGEASTGLFRLRVLRQVMPR